MQTDEKHLVEYECGLLWITEKETLLTWVVGMTNDKGQSIVKGQYESSCKKYKPERVIKTFKKLATDKSPMKVYKRLPKTT